MCPLFLPADSVSSLLRIDIQVLSAGPKRPRVPEYGAKGLHVWGLVDHRRWRGVRLMCGSVFTWRDPDANEVPTLRRALTKVQEGGGRLGHCSIVTTEMVWRVVTGDC